MLSLKRYSHIVVFRPVAVRVLSFPRVSLGYTDRIKLAETLTWCTRNRGSYMNFHVLLNLLIGSGIRDKMQGSKSILSLIDNVFNTLKNTGA